MWTDDLKVNSRSLKREVNSSTKKPSSYEVVAKVLKTCKKCDWMAFNSQLLNFDRTDSNAIFNMVFIGLFYIIISKPISYLSDKTRRKKLLKKGTLLRLSAYQGLNVYRIALQRKPLPKVYKNPGSNLSGISDLRQCWNIEVRKGSKNNLNLSREKKRKWLSHGIRALYTIQYAN